LIASTNDGHQSNKARECLFDGHASIFFGRPQEVKKAQVFVPVM
jgi:hypothetical protein